MAAPVFQAAGTFQSGAGVALTVPWPASHAVDDIAILVLSNGTAAAVGLATANGFVAIPGSTQTATGLGGEVFWCRATSTSMASPITNTAGNNISGVIVTVRGCVTTGNPWEAISTSAKTTTSTATSITGATTLLPETLIVYAAARAADFAANQYSGEADATLTGVAERADNGTVSGNGGGIGIWTGTKATAGAYGPLTATLANTSTELYWSIALKPPTPAGTVDVVITAGADDGFSYTAFDGTGNNVAAGNISAGPLGSWFRFLNVTIPQGATINSAVLVVEADSPSGTVTAIRTQLRADDIDNATAPTSVATFNALTRTTAKVDFDPAVWVISTVYSLPDLAAVVQEVTDRAGWVSGNALQLLWDDDGTSPTNTYAIGGSFESVRREPRLIVTYTAAAGATGTVAVTQADQTSTASATETLTATSAQTQAAQTSTASGSVANPVTGTVAQTQADQTSTATAAESFTGTSANVQAAQTSTASGSVGAAPITGTVTVTQADQTSTASGLSVQNLAGTVAVTQADQISTATAVEAFTGTLAEIQDDQTSTATATFGFTGTVGVTQDNQTSTASGISAVAITGTVAVTQQDQFSTATANGGTVTFWVPYPVGYVFNPVAYVSNPAGFVRVGPDSIPPAW